MLTSKPTDHYELENTSNESIKNTEIKPTYISADTGYHNEISFKYLEKTSIIDLIPWIGKQSRTKKGKLSKKPYHKDNFQYDFKENVFIYPENQKLHFQHYNKTQKPKNKRNIRKLNEDIGITKHAKNAKSKQNAVKSHIIQIT